MWLLSAHQCRKWLADMKEAGGRANIEYIVGGPKELAGMAL